MPDSGHIEFSIADEAATVRLNRPGKRNAVSPQMWDEIDASLVSAAADPRVRALVIEGLPGIFCAGADLAWINHASADHAKRYRDLSLAMYAAIRDFPRPTVAVIDGPCIGGGCNIALACDIRIAGPRASFAIPAVRHGIVYDPATVARLTALVGFGRASHLLFTAERIGAARAAEIGLVDIAAEDAAARLAEFLAALRLADMTTLTAVREHVRSALAGQMDGK